MEKHRITFETPAPAQRTDLSEGNARGRVLLGAWRDRRETDWTTGVEPLPARTPLDGRRHKVTLVVVNAGEVDGEPVRILRMAVDVAVASGSDPLAAALQILDMAPRPKASRMPAEPRALVGSALHPISGGVVIGPMPSDWPIGRRVTAISTAIGSYGMGGLGFLGMQANGGSWIVLPLAGSSRRVTATIESVEPDAARTRLDVVVDRRTLEAWEHDDAPTDVDGPKAFAARRPEVRDFEADADGFAIEMGDNMSLMRLEVGRGAPDEDVRPMDLREGDDVGAAFTLCHDPYVDV